MGTHKKQEEPSPVKRSTEQVNHTTHITSAAQHTHTPKSETMNVKLFTGFLGGWGRENGKVNGWLKTLMQKKEGEIYKWISSPIYDAKGLDFCIRNRIEFNNFGYFGYFNALSLPPPKKYRTTKK